MRLYYDKAFEPKTSTVFISLGVSRTFENEYHMLWLFFPLENQLIIDDKTQLNELPVTIHNFDPTGIIKKKNVLPERLSSVWRSVLVIWNQISKSVMLQLLQLM